MAKVLARDALGGTNFLERYDRYAYLE